MKERESLNYYVLDVFTNERYKGNPLAVVFTKKDLQLFEYENIAREFGYSETSFVYYSKELKAMHVRSFTPTGFEVDGAGHNLLGAVCAALLAKMKVFETGNTDGLVLIKGKYIPIVISNDSNQAPIVKMRQQPASIVKEIPTSIIAKALGIDVNNLKIKQITPTVVQTEVAHAMVPISDVEVLNNIQPDNQQLIEISKQYGFEGFYCFVFNEKGLDNIAEARFFNPLIGIDEDAATGTAAGPLAGFLCHSHLLQSNKKYQILQGVKLNQPSLIEVMVRDTDILVGGSSIITMRGEIYL